MRIMGDFGRFVAATAAGLVVVAGGVAGYPAYAQATQQPGTAALGSAASHAAVTVATVPVPAYGNPNGHAFVPWAARAVSTAHPNHVIGNGRPASCTSAAVVRAVARGGIIKFNCGLKPVTIVMTATAKVVNTHRRIVIDGAGLITLSGGGKRRILYMNTCDRKQVFTTNDCWEQQWPQLIVQNITFRNGYSGTHQTATSNYGGGAIFDQGGQLKVVNSGFFNNKCYRYGPDLGGGAIRAFGMYMRTPVYITHDTFRSGRCSNGGALSGLYANFDVINSLMLGNKAIGWGKNPADPGTPGGGSGGAIYTDGNSYNLTIAGSVIRYSSAREGGGAIFFVVNNGPGTLTIKAHSRLNHNPNGTFGNAPGIFDSVDGNDVPPTIINSSVR
jgi:hypothetical protein